MKNILSSINRDLRHIDADILTTSDVYHALSIMEEGEISVIICDINMPIMNGIELLKQLIITSPETIRIVLTGSTETNLFQTAVNEAKITTFLFKPWDTQKLIAYVNQAIKLFIYNKDQKECRHETHIKNKQLQAWNDRLEKEAIERIESVNLAQDATIISLAALTETRDNETGAHILRTQKYVKTLAEKLSLNPKYSTLLTPETIISLYKSATLHDIGKVGIADAILKKPGKLTEQEFAEMKTHTTLGHSAIAKAEEKLGPIFFLKHASEIAYSHHEKWDGTGYPEGLKGESIPLSARIMAIADVYDALISKRCYKDSFDHHYALSIIKDERGKHFQPELVDICLELSEEFQAIARIYAD